MEERLEQRASGRHRIITGAVLLRRCTLVHGNSFRLRLHFKFRELKKRLLHGVFDGERPVETLTLGARASRDTTATSTNLLD
jgi:hypothetical protein